VSAHDVLVDAAPVFGHDAIGDGEEALQNGMDLFGTDLSAESRVAYKVREEHGHVTPFGISRDRGRGGNGCRSGFSRTG
jgi:hypothetical protein